MARFALSWPAALSILAGVASLALARWIWRFRGRPGARYWTGVQVATGVWALAYGAALTTFDPALRPLFEYVVWLARSAAPPLVLLFALEYTGRDRLIRAPLGAALLGFWGVGFLIHATNSLHHLAWVGYRIEPVFGAAAVEFTPRPVLYFFATAAWVFDGVAVALVLGPLLTYRRLFARQAAAIAVVIVLPTAANVLWLFQVGPTGHLDLTPIMFLVLVAVMSYALFREELFELLPATTRVANDIAIDDLNAAVLTVSPEGRLIDTNSVAASLFGLDRANVLGRPVDDALPVGVALEPGQFSLSDPAGESREFDVEVSVIESSPGRMVGYVLVLTDVTEERRRRQRLAVQNRVLRHNLRNGLTVVDGNAEQVREVATDGSVEPLVENIRETSAELMQMSEKVRRFDTALSGETYRVDVADLCRTVVEDFADRYPSADVDFEADGTATVELRDALLRQVLEEVIENGIVHCESGTPRVDVRLTTTEDRVAIAVEDAGPGIPDAEVAPLRSGEEDPLTHGTGVGLWVVEWGIESLGGSVAFESASGGTRVTLQLPR